MKGPLTAAEAEERYLKEFLKISTTAIGKEFDALTEQLLEDVATVTRDPTVVVIGSPKYKKIMARFKKSVAQSLVELKGSVLENMLAVSQDTLELYSSRDMASPSISTKSLADRIVVAGDMTAAVAISKYSGMLAQAASTALIKGINAGKYSVLQESMRQMLIQEERRWKMLQGNVTSGTMNYVEGQVANANPELMGWQILHATFENTCIRCASLNGTKYKAGTGPFLPIHGHCRCYFTYVAVEPKGNKKSLEKSFNLKSPTIRKMFGAKTLKLLDSGKVSISDILKPILNSEGRIVDVKVATLRELLSK